MGITPTRNTIHNPTIFHRPQVLADIRSRKRQAWIDQPLWPQKNVQFDKNAKSHRKKLIIALADTANPTSLHQLAYELYMCSPDTPCGSPLCNYCRTRLQDRVEKRALGYFGGSNRSDLCFLTVLHKVTYNPAQDATRLQKHLKRKIKRVFENDLAVKDVRVFGGFELDAKNPSTMEHRKAATTLLRDYGMNTDDDVAYMPHFHAIVDLNGVDAQAFCQTLRETFIKPKQISLSMLYPDKTKEYHIGRLARYMFKFRYQFADNIMRAKPSYGNPFDGQTMCDFAETLLAMTKGKRGARSFELKFNL